MRFFWPEQLWLAPLLPMLVVLSVWLMRRRTYLAGLLTLASAALSVWWFGGVV